MKTSAQIMIHSPFTPNNLTLAASTPSDIDDYIYGDAGVCPSER